MEKIMNQENSSSVGEKKPGTGEPEVKSYWAIIKPVRKYIYFAMGVSSLSSILSVVAVVAFAYVINALVENNTELAWKYFYYGFVLELFAFLTRGSSFKLSHIGSFKLEAYLRKDIMEKVTYAPLGKLQQFGAAALTKIVQDDVRDIHVFVADSTPLYAKAMVAPLTTLIMMFIIDWRNALVAVALIGVGAIFLSFAFDVEPELIKNYNKGREDIAESVIEFVQAMPVVRTFDGGQASYSRYENALTSFVKLVSEWWRRSSFGYRVSRMILAPLPTLLAFVWFNIYLLTQDHYTFKLMLPFLLIGTGLIEAVMPLMSLNHLIQNSKISIQRITEVQELQPLKKTDDPQTTDDYSITFKHVYFSYNEDENYAIKDVSFHVPEHTFTALVGPSGAGKTTVARLIPRYWDVTKGCIQIGNIDVRDFDPDALMQQIAFVFQDNFLFSGTIAENIKLGYPNKSMDEVIAAAKAAQVHDFIEELPNGYDTLVTERGSNLSGGQRQRITIARAILQDRPIIILDEATAFSGAENEVLIMKAIQNLMKEKTVIMIAHRLATIQNADQILMFEDGELAEAGSPHELLNNNGAYKRLWDDFQKAQHWTINSHDEEVNNG